MDLSRRQAVHRLSLLVGGALSAPTLGALLAGCRATPTASEWTPRILDPERLDVLTLAVDRIIPATDTPGASEVGVPAFIDRLLADWMDPEDRDRFVAGLDALAAGGPETSGMAFRDATPEERDALLSRLDVEAVRAREEEADPLPFFATLKEWTLVGYYTSEAGATEELRWMAIPGRYQGDIPLGEVGRTWA